MEEQKFLNGSLKVLGKVFVGGLVTMMLAAAIPAGAPYAKHFNALLKDPSSAQFEVVSKPKGKICGRFNTKNSYGAFVGFKPFVYVADNDTVFTTNEVVMSDGTIIDPTKLVGGDSMTEIVRRSQLAQRTLTAIEQAFEGC